MTPKLLIPFLRFLSQKSPQHSKIGLRVENIPATAAHVILLMERTNQCSLSVILGRETGKRREPPPPSRQLSHSTQVLMRLSIIRLHLAGRSRSPERGESEKTGAILQQKGRRGFFCRLTPMRRREASCRSHQNHTKWPIYTVARMFADLRVQHNSVGMDVSRNNM